MNADRDKRFGLPDELKKEIGRRIRERRKASQYRRTIDAYEKLGIARSTYNGYEMGVRTPDIEMLTKLAEIFETDVEYLMCNTDDPRPTAIKANEIEQKSNEIFEVLSSKDLTINGEKPTEDQWEQIHKLLTSIGAK